MKLARRRFKKQRNKFWGCPQPLPLKELSRKVYDITNALLKSRAAISQEKFANHSLNKGEDMPNELEEFLKDVHDDSTPVDLLEQPLMETQVEEPEKETEAPKNRSERRSAARRWERELEERQRELDLREARQQAVAEYQAKQAPTEVPDEWLQMFGDKPETRQAWALQQKLDEQKFNRLRDEIKAETLREQEEVRQQERQAEQELEEIFDSIEETHNIDLSSSTPAAKKARTEYLEALAAVSHKNAQGEVDVFGDPNTAYELWELKRSKQASPAIQRQKDLASRDSGSTPEVNVNKSQDDAVRAYLRSEGINV